MRYSALAWRRATPYSHRLPLCGRTDGRNVTVRLTSRALALRKADRLWPAGVRIQPTPLVTAKSEAVPLTAQVPPRGAAPSPFWTERSKSSQAYGDEDGDGEGLGVGAADGEGD